MAEIRKQEINISQLWNLMSRLDVLILKHGIKAAGPQSEILMASFIYMHQN